MTIDERIARVENALIAAGLMVNDPHPSCRQILEDINRGDFTSWRAFCKSEFANGNNRPMAKLNREARNE